MSARALIADLDAAAEGVRRAPVLAARLSNNGASVPQFLNAYAMALAGVGGYDVPRDATHIRSRAARNRKRNKAAKASRKRNR